MTTDQGLTAIIPGSPIPQGSKRIGVFKQAGMIRHRIIDGNPQLKFWRLAVTTNVRQAMADCDWTKVPGPVVVTVHFWLTRPKGDYGTGRNVDRVKPSADAFPIRHPDLDKLLRAILDGCTDAGVWEDDAQVISIAAYKLYATVENGPRTQLTVRALV